MTPEPAAITGDRDRWFPALIGVSSHSFSAHRKGSGMHSNMNNSPAGLSRIGKAERKHKVVVIKVGTSSLLRKGHLHLSMLGALAEACSDLSRAGCKVIVVTSGAVGAGCQVLGAVRAPPFSSNPRISSFRPPSPGRRARPRRRLPRVARKLPFSETRRFREYDTDEKTFSSPSRAFPKRARDELTAAHHALSFTTNHIIVAKTGEAQ